MKSIQAGKSSAFRTVGFLILLFTSSSALAATRTVDSTSNDATTIGTLPYWLINAGSGDTIDCSAIAGQTITLTASLPAITASYTIDGAGITIDGAGSYQAFQVASGTVVIDNVNVQNALSKVGTGAADIQAAVELSEAAARCTSTVAHQSP